MILRVTYHLLVGDDVMTEYDHRELNLETHATMLGAANGTITIKNTATGEVLQIPSRSINYVTISRRESG